MKKALLNQLRIERFDKLSIEERGQLVNELRMEHNFTYRKLGELTGIPHTTLVDWATGRQKDGGKAGHLHISIERLINHFSVYKPTESEKPLISILIRKLESLIK